MSDATTSAAAMPTITAESVRPLEPRAEWRADDVDDSDQWTLHLSAEDLEELDAALTHARSRTDDVLDVTADDFPLPALRPRLDLFAEELVNGRGFGRIGIIDVDRLGPEDASWIYWGI